MFSFPQHYMKSFSYYLVTYSPKCPFPWHRGAGRFLSWRCCTWQPTHLHILGTHLKSFEENSICMQWNKVVFWGNNVILFNKEGEGLNREKNWRPCISIAISTPLLFYSCTQRTLPNVKFSNDCKLVCKDFICH